MAKFVSVLNNPGLVKEVNGRCKLTAYLTCAYRSIAIDVYRRYSKENVFIGGGLTGVGGDIDPLALMLWQQAEKLTGVRGEVFHLYMLGLTYRSEHGGIAKAYTHEGIAQKLGLTPACVATHIHRAKLSLKAMAMRNSLKGNRK